MRAWLGFLGVSILVGTVSAGGVVLGYWDWQTARWGWATLAALLLGLTGWQGYRVVYRLWRRRKVAQGPTVLLLPRADLRPVDPSRLKLWARMADALPHDEPISWEIWGHQDQSGFALHGSEEGVQAAMTQIRAEWPGTHRRATSEAYPDPAIPPEGWAVWWVELRPKRWDRPLTPSGDPLRAILLELSAIQGNGRGLVQVILQRDYGTRRKLGRMAFRARNIETRSKGLRSAKTQEARILEERARQTFLRVTVRCVGMADTPKRAKGMARALARGLAAAFSGENPLRWVRQGRNPRSVRERRMGRAGPWTSTEVAYLAHLAGSNLAALAPRLLTAPARFLPASPEMRIPPHAQVAVPEVLNG